MGAVGPLDRRADLRDRSSCRIHLHRVTRDVETKFSREAVEIPLRPAVRIPSRDETVFVALVSVALAPAEARDVAEDVGSAPRELIHRANDVRRLPGVWTRRDWREWSKIATHPR